MTPESIRAELVALRERLDALVAALPAAAPAPPPVEPEPRRMKVGQYARARSYAPRTISSWCAAGMPHIGEGKARRILVAEADRWIADGGPQRAAEAARRAGREAAARAVMQ